MGAVSATPTSAAMSPTLFTEAVPHDVVDVYLVAHEQLATRVDVEYAHQTVALLTEKVEKRAVLTELIRIGRVVDGTVVVTEKQNQAVAHLAAPARRGALYRSFLRT